MFDFDVYIAAAVFFSSFFLDLIAARYTYYVMSLHAERAAALSFVWHMVSAVVVIEYAHNAAYIVFVCLGGGLGTYLTIWAKRRHGAASRTVAAVAVLAPAASRAEAGRPCDRSASGQHLAKAA